MSIGPLIMYSRKCDTSTTIYEDAAQRFINSLKPNLYSYIEAAEITYDYEPLIEYEATFLQIDKFTKGKLRAFDAEDTYAPMGTGVGELGYEEGKIMEDEWHSWFEAIKPHLYKCVRFQLRQEDITVTETEEEIKGFTYDILEVSCKYPGLEDFWDDIYHQFMAHEFTRTPNGIRILATFEDIEDPITEPSYWFEMMHGWLKS